MGENEKIFYFKNKAENRRYDVAVAGGGLAGVAASVTAARSGLKTAIVEKYNCLGGMATSGLVNPFCNYR